MRVRYIVIFTGSVQGVGFRYTTCNIGAGYRVVGWVRNEPDGSVRCVVEGEKGELDRFVSAIRQLMQGHIADAHIELAPATGEFAGFSIRR